MKFLQVLFDLWKIYRQYHDVYLLFNIQYCFCYLQHQDALIDIIEKFKQLQSFNYVHIFVDSL